MKLMQPITKGVLICCYEKFFFKFCSKCPQVLLVIPLVKSISGPTKYFSIVIKIRCKNLFWYNSFPGFQLAANFCVYHDNTAVMSCAQFCCDYFMGIWMRSLILIRDIKIMCPRFHMCVCACVVVLIYSESDFYIIMHLWLLGVCS